MPVFYLGWVNEGIAFNPATHATVTQKIWDGTEGGEIVFSLVIDHAEGAFPGLKAELVNPRVGLLSAGRNQWVWLSADFGAGAQALFNGRIIGVPKRLADEVIEVEFIARPADFIEQKEDLADTLKVTPYWDPIWIQEGIDNPDTVLEAYPMRWHIDRVTLAVTSSSTVEGEDGIIDVSADEHFYDGVEVSYGPQPKRRIKVKLTGTWTQTGEGEVDLTRRLVTLFQDAGSPFQLPMVSSYTADGLLDDWPKPLASLGGGWSMAENSSAAFATYAAPYKHAVRYIDKSDSTAVKGFTDPGDGSLSYVFLDPGLKKTYYINWKIYDVLFLNAPILADFRITYAASRKRSEVATFTVEADIQSIMTDPGAAEEETLELSTEFIDEPVDVDSSSPSGMVMPIGDPARNVYFPTDRGIQSIEYPMLVARAKLLASARAVDIKFASTWEKLALVISCRKSVTLHDPRLPEGQAAGKIKTYRLAADGEGEITAEATIGCMIGYGVALSAAAAGEDTYADDYADDYTETTGGETAVIAGEVHYERLDGTYLIDDDGLDLFNMTPETVVNTLTITDGPQDQNNAIEASMIAAPAEFKLQTRGDVDGTAVSNLTDVTGLVTGTRYKIAGGAIPTTNQWRLGTWQSVLTATPNQVYAYFTFDGNVGGTLNLASTIPTLGAYLTITEASGALFLPDPLAALELHPTVVALDLKPVTGGDFMTEYTVVVLPIVVPTGINLEAIS